ncbi:MAG: bifunctional serine/threonine-protein kinase/formylglycine-generating enzyme family protein [Kofleriaceae bacterium]
MVEAAWSPPSAFEEYRLVQPLGHGAMGQVYLAHDSLLDRAVAVKFPRASSDDASRERFFSEARAIARLQHPNVVAVYRVAEVNGHPYLVSEYVRGQPLDELARPVSSSKALALAIDLARGLAAAHRCGVLHRDVKPANAMLTEDGQAKLLDFGLATVGNLVDPVIGSPPPRALAPSRHLATIDVTQSSYAREPLSGDDDGERPSVVGTPLYTAPEIWRGEPASRRSDLYSLGILLYELLAGIAPHRGVAMAELPDVVQHRDVPRLGTVVPGVDPALAAIVDRLIDRDPSARFGSADALLLVLEEIAAPSRATDVPLGNPYRGLAAFSAAQGSLFFGRRTEIRELVDRVRTEALVVVGGDSGAGKSSLCHAGVVPWLVEHDGWSCIDVVPGKRPIHALAVVLATWCGVDERTLETALRESPDAVARMIRQSTRKLIVFVDQLEELLTLSEPAEARSFAAALAALAPRTPALRVLATARSDFLSRLAMLPGLGDEMARALYFLRPLSGERIREAIVCPAAVKGVRFEPEALVDTLVEQTEHSPGGLPLLQFTLAELWDSRDVDAKVIRADALAALGGVGGALSRHADHILAGLDVAGRAAARDVVLRLVTAERTRARRSEAELLVAGGDRTALEVLVRGRIVVANDSEDGAYEIAHEALLASWSTLQGWLDETATDHVARRRLEQAAAEWVKAGRDRELLWPRRKLAAVRALDRTSLGTRQQAFLSASRRRVIRTRVVIAASVTAVTCAAIVVGLGLRARAHRKFEAVSAEQTAHATREYSVARSMAGARDAARTRAFALFASHKWPAGEDVWDEAEKLGALEATHYRTASRGFESALSLDPTSATLRDQHAGLLFERLLRARRDRSIDLAAELAGRLAAYDNGRMAALEAAARITVDVPAGTQIFREQAGDRALVTPVFDTPPGAFVLAFEAPGRAPARLPVYVTHAEQLALAVTLPPAMAVPDGMLYVPAGRFLFGSADSSDLRRGFLNSPPMHELTTPAYLIARHEVTFASWIEFLDSLPPKERGDRTPNSSDPQASTSLTEIAPRRWRYTYVRASKTYQADMGTPVAYEGRVQRVRQDWLKFPVAAISYEDALAYAAWLDHTHRVPGARLCDEHEWERAARGADGRTWPTGETLGPDDANIDLTYGRKTFAYGPDEVGSHPRSRSPVGADDMAGNVWEWTSSVETPNAGVLRGGGYYQEALSSRSTNREPSEPALRHVWLGARICANAPTNTPTATR